MPEINNKKSNSIYFEDGLLINDFGSSLRFSDMFETYCWVKDKGSKNFATWVELSAQQVNR